MSASEGIAVPMPPRVRNGRPTLLTAGLADRICESIRLGNYMETAAALHGLNKTTLYRWLKAGARLMRECAEDEQRELDEQEALLVSFCNAVRQAQAQAEARAVESLMTADDPRWRAWWLERTRADRFGRKDKLRVVAGGEGEKEEPLDLTHLSVAELEQLQRLLAKGEREDTAALPAHAEGEDP